MAKTSLSANNYSSPPEQGGYIVLLSVIFMSALLLALSTGLSARASINRSNGLIAEARAGSYELAASCAQQVILNYALDSNYAGNETITMDNDQCIVEPLIITESFITIVSSGITTKGTAKVKSVFSTINLGLTSQYALIN